MLFNSFVFIFLFLPITLAGYFILSRLRLYLWAKWALIAASLYFYAFFNLSYLPIIISSILVNYGAGYVMTRTKNHRTGERSRWINIAVLVLALAFNIGMLGYFKYTDFLIENINVFFGKSYLLRNILLPLGISFFTFQQLAFVADCYRGKGVMPGFTDYCTFVTFFPQLIAGPIVLPEEMLPQFADSTNRRPVARNIFDGLFIFTLGLAKKAIIADTLGSVADIGFEHGIESFTMAEAWLIALSYTFQLYFDFSGYCDMAIGIARMFNINLPLNFNAPYRATDFQDFWRRWHMTLNRFLTQYLYIPLGGSRVREWRVLLNIALVFFISGVWHGAGWTFIIWGVCHGLGVMTRRVWHKRGFRMPSWLGMFVTFFFINILWVIFRAHDLHQAWVVIRSMFDNTSRHFTGQFTFHLPANDSPLWYVGVLFVAMLLGFLGPTAYRLMTDYDSPRLKQIAIVLLFTASLCYLTHEVTFLYFNF